MRMTEIGTEFTMPLEKGGTYHVQLPPEDYLLLVAGVNVGTAGEHFDCPTVAARVPSVFDIKHYHPSGRKWWTTQAGVNLFFVVPKRHIELIEEPGYSYPKVKIGDRTYSLNVSGGTFPSGDWTDMIYQGAHTGINHPLKSLKNLAKHSLNTEVCEAKDISFPITKRNREKEYLELLAKKTMQKKLRPGKSIMLIPGTYYSTPGNRGPFTIDQKHGKRRTFLCLTGTGRYFRATYKYIDWTETAKVNEVKLSVPETINRVGKILEPKE